MSETPLERISWSVYCPFPGVRAYAEFAFAERNRRQGTRYPKLRGRTYSSNRYNSAMEVLNLDLGTDDYLILKTVNQRGDEPGKVVMSYPHLRRFVEGLQESLEMVRDGCFEEVDGAYQLTKRGLDAVVVVHDLFGGSSIAFQPTIFTRQAEEDVQDGEEIDLAGIPGMRMYLNSDDVYSDVTLDDYATFVQFYERFDLFATSRAAVQVAVTQLGGVPGATMTKTPAAMPARKNAGNLGLPKK